METIEETRNSDQIERDIEKTRNEMAGTLDDIQKSFSPGQIVDQAIGYIEEKSGSFGSNLMHTVRDNPVPVTLVGVGLAWLATSYWNDSAAGDSSDARYEGRTTPVRGHRTGAIRYGSRSTSAQGGTAYGEAYGPDYRSGGGSAGEAAGHVRGAMSQAAGQVEGAMSHAAETVKQKASETAGQVKETVGQVRDKAAEMTSEARQRAVEVTHKVEDRARHMIEDEPLVVGALGFTIGAALGAMLPRTPQEDRLLGEARDELLQQADQTGGEMLKNVREQVETMAESATAKAEQAADSAQGAGTETSPSGSAPGTAGESGIGHRGDAGLADMGPTGQPIPKPPERREDPTRRL